MNEQQETPRKRRRKRPERYVDLQVHTTFSDGTRSPTEVVKLASAAKLKAVAITDHDTIDGIPEALAQGTRSRIEVIAGLEIAANCLTGIMDILGYFIDIASPSLESRLRRLRESREERNPKIIAKLQDMGVDIVYGEVIEIAGGATVGRPHIARVLVQKGCAKDIDEAFRRYLGRNAPAYVPKERPSSGRAIELIRDAGGVPVLAHPDTIDIGLEGDLDLLVARLVREGLLGIEVMYSGYEIKTTTSLTRLAEKHNILAAGGSDFHGDPGSDIQIGTGKGELRVPYRFAESLRDAARLVRRKTAEPAHG
ncbi:MAG: PHP domain-containing protein [Planctomycetes bacterium]|nr:PHP domain-containing protein [Planctomycetota bacterium]